MGVAFWLRRFLIALVGASLILFAFELIKGHPTDQAMGFATLWGFVFAVIFTGTGYIRYRRNPACMLPPDRRL